MNRAQELALRAYRDEFEGLVQMGSAVLSPFAQQALRYLQLLMAENEILEAAILAIGETPATSRQAGERMRGLAVQAIVDVSKIR